MRNRVPAAGEAVPVDPPNRNRRRSVGVSRWRACLRWTEFILLFPGAQFEENRI
ncbi:hypothetical protein [Mesorhizobium sp. M0058]|uniref:hypothetical protein n=1 Tax=Mesorhizobium sp. M0058 TaxID=2956865 RepID=UPI0033366402